MKTIVNAAPFVNLLGIQDASGRPPVITPEQVPTHLPLVYLYTQSGPTTPQLVSGDALAQMYGASTLDPRSAFYNHQSELAATVQGQGNPLMVQRVVPEDIGPKARLLLSLDIVADDIQQYERNTDGTFKLDEDGNKVPVIGPDATVEGYKARWVINKWLTGETTEAFGECAERTGSIVSTSGDQSQLYPILELEAYWLGGYGNNLGIRLDVPTTQSENPLNESVANAVKSFLYRFQAVSRTSAASSGTVVETLGGDQWLTFTFKEGAIDLSTDSELSWTDVFPLAYTDQDTPGLPPVYGPFGRSKIYKDNLTTVLAMIGAKEAAYGTLPVPSMDAQSEYLDTVNPFTAQAFDGTPYYSLALQGPADGGVLFGQNTTFYAEGASDGTMNDAAFDTLVGDQLTNFGGDDYTLMDDAMYPFSCVYDSGFSIDTKKAMLAISGKRKDIYSVVSTQDVSLPQNDQATESSMALALKTFARNYPESEIYGTSVCRAIIIGHSGYLINSKYKGLLPLTLEFAAKCANYMGAGNHLWASGLGFDTPPNNQISMFRGVNATFKQASVRNKDWTNGLVWVQNYDRQSQFWPAVQTVYDDDSSILNSAINMIIAVDLEKIAQRVYRDLTGISSLTDAQFADRCNRYIDERTQGRYDNRVTVVPDTYYTSQDVARGYSWSCKISLYGPSMKTVGTFTVVARRQSDLQAAA